MDQPAPVFISYATADRAQALAICKAIESRGTRCWISTRDVAPGQNYQEEIVRALREARAMVLVFSGAANDSEEIKKELSLASRFRVPVMALRIEDVEPSDAFAYELSTRQWIDAFDGGEEPIDLIVGHLSHEPGAASAPAPAATVAAASRKTTLSPRALAAAAAVLLVAAAGAFLWLRPTPTAAHSMAVRVAGFRTLSTDLPANLHEAVDAEIAAAFNADGVVGVSTAATPAPGDAPAYAVSGTIRRDGDTVRVITQLANERSGVTLWTDTFDYPASELDNIPRHVAVDAGNVVRCGLFGASTYSRPLSDAVLRDYMQFCQGHWDPDMANGRKALVPAQRVVAAAPDFSWGWAGVAGAYWKVAMTADDPALAAKASASGREAADRAISLDGQNSEALWIKSLLIDPYDWGGREDLLKRAVAARRLDCGCEHHQYGVMLAGVGRLNDAVEQLRQANDMLALYVYTPLSLADALVAAGKPGEAKEFFDEAARLAPNARFARGIELTSATDSGDLGPLLNDRDVVPAERRAALVAGYEAARSGDDAARARAAQALVALPPALQNTEVARLLGRLGDAHDAFAVASRLAASGYGATIVLWYPETRGVLNDPGFPALAERLGLMRYWKASGTIPDVCGEAAAPPFCGMI